MRKINLQQLFKNNWIHFLALGLFVLTTFIYFQPQFSGHGLKQHDIEQFIGASNEINHYRETHGEEPLWTNSMFGGMPTYLISLKISGNLLGYIYNIFHLWLKSPAGMFFGYLLGFYIMLLCMRVNPKVAILGAFAFAFSSYYIVILQAGHNTKAAAIGLAPPIIGAFYLAFRGKLKWGILLSALFMGLELFANHVQITYYLGILLLFLGLGEFIRHLREKRLIKFVKVSFFLFLAYGFAIGINYGKLALTQDYAQHSIRGGNDIDIHPDGTGSHKIKTTGLDKDYITQWSYGISESMTLISPNIKGGASSALKDSQFSEMLRSSDYRKEANLIAKNNIYWGNQPFTSGPVYLGIIVFFLAVLGMVYLKGPRKWVLLGATILTLMLSWGKNFMGLTDFFLDYVPFYNKFRAVTIILVIVELTIPLLAVLFLNQLIKKREQIKNNIQPFYIVSGGMVALLTLLTFTGLGDGYMNSKEKDFLYSYPDQVKAQLQKEDPQKLRENGIDITKSDQVNQVVEQQMKRVNAQFDALLDVRQSIYRSSMGRSIFFLIIGIIFIGLFLKTSIKKEYVLGGLLVFILIDLVGVDINYLNNKKSNGRDYDYWMELSDKMYPLTPTSADKEILAQELANQPELKKLVENVKVDAKDERGRVNKDALWLEKFQTLEAHTNYRVYDPSLGFNSANVSYFHKALNGYHGAKLRRIQNLKDFYIDYNDMNILNMLNVKYFIQNGKAMENPGALGPVWLVKEVNVQPNPNKELLALGNMFTIENKSNQKLLVNDIAVNSDTISGRERIVLFDEDSLQLNLSSIMRSGVGATFVQDVNGQTNWLPTSELEKDSLNSFTPLVSVERIHHFDPKNMVVVGERVANDLSTLTYSGAGTIEMTSYAPNELKYKVDVDGVQFAVFSEMYYPDGWNAYLNGEKIDIKRVDYLLRGIELPTGSHELVMKFEEPKFVASNYVALAGSLILFLLIGGFFIKDFILSKKTNPENE